VAVSVGIILVFLLMFFIQVYYVKPIYSMLEALKDYLGYRRRYTFTFDGFDQLSDLNNSITELAEENRSLRKRISDLKEKQ
jgi:sensor histidine kinase YesM